MLGSIEEGGRIRVEEKETFLSRSGAPYLFWGLRKEEREREREADGGRPIRNR